MTPLTTPTVFDPVLHPESTRLEAWMAQGRARGLVDFHVSLANPPLEASYEAVEALAGELNRALAAPSLPDPGLD